MGERSLKVSIAGRDYPVTVKSADAERIAKASELIEERVSAFEKAYGVKDKQDLLAMCVLQFATQYLESQENSQVETVEVKQRLEEMEKFVSEYLKRDKAA